MDFPGSNDVAETAAAQVETTFSNLLCSSVLWPCELSSGHQDINRSDVLHF